MRNALTLIFLTMMAGLPTLHCGEENVLGSLPECTPEIDTVIKVDTFRTSEPETITDTLYRVDTVRTTVLDTVGFVVGRPNVLIFSTVFRDSNPAMGTDSVYASLTCFSSPYARTLSPTVNAQPLTYTEGQVMASFLDGFIYRNFSLFSASILSSMVGATYQGSYPFTTSSFDWNVEVPYYAQATDTALTYDTLSSTIGLPGVLEGIQLLHDGGIPYDSVDNLKTDSIAYRIAVNKDLEVAWDAVGDWYAVQVMRALATGGGGYPVGEILDTALVNPFLVLDSAFLYQDTLFDERTYHYLDIRVVPVRGPAPSTWDTLTGFGGSGYTFSFRSEFGMAQPNAFPVYPVYAKRMSVMRGRENPGALEIVNRIMAKQGLQLQP